MAEHEGAITPAGYSGAEYWNDYHQLARGRRLNRMAKLQVWLHSLVPFLEKVEKAHVLDLGCGGGHDALELARHGYSVSGCDISGVAIREARALAAERRLLASFVEHDIAEPLPYPDGLFGAVISNLTLHMFTADIAQRVVAEVWRCLLPGGFFAFHVNSTADLPYRRKLQPPVTQLDNGMYCFGRGQTMRFFSEQDCRQLVVDWKLLLLEPVQMLREDGAVQKCAWRCVAQKPKLSASEPDGA